MLLEAEVVGAARLGMRGGGRLWADMLAVESFLCMGGILRKLLLVFPPILLLLLLLLLLPLGPATGAEAGTPADVEGPGTAFVVEEEEVEAARVELDGPDALAEAEALLLDSTLDRGISAEARAELDVEASPDCW